MHESEVHFEVLGGLMAVSCTGSKHLNNIIYCLFLEMIVVIVPQP